MHIDNTESLILAEFNAAHLHDQRGLVLNCLPEVPCTHLQSQPTANKALIGVGAILGGALLFVTEIDTVLEVAGIFAAGNFALKNLLFADDRKRTQGDIK